MKEDTDKIGYCDHHNNFITSETFEYKGCWNCGHFAEKASIGGQSATFPYIDVQEAAQLFNVSPATIRAWIKKGKLRGYLFIRQRHLPFISPPNKKYFIEKTEEIKEMIENKKGTEDKCY